MPSLCCFAGAPGFFPGAFMCEFVLKPCHRRCVSILVKLSYVLMSENVPVIFGTDRSTRARRRVAGTPFGHSIGEFPSIRSNFFLVPLALVVIPFVPPADLHSGVFFPLENFKRVIGLRQIF